MVAINYQMVVDGEVSRILCDERDLEYRLGTTDTFRAAEFIAASAPRVALVCAEQNLPDAGFRVDVTVNRGLKARVFTDLDEAHAWLATTPTPAT